MTIRSSIYVTDTACRQFARIVFADDSDDELSRLDKALFDLVDSATFVRSQNNGLELYRARIPDSEYALAAGRAVFKCKRLSPERRLELIVSPEPRPEGPCKQLIAVYRRGVGR